MRIWSLHPKYLDSKGMVALWRETLLAKNVLEGNTKGYKNHPQLNRFKDQEDPLSAINYYLEELFKEAKNRSYNFDSNKFIHHCQPNKINVTNGQMNYELNHLKKKLEIRDKSKLQEILNIKDLEPHPLFNVIDGEIESWEII